MPTIKSTSQPRAKEATMPTLVIRSKNSYWKYRDKRLVGNCGPGYRLGEGISPEERKQAHDAKDLERLCSSLAAQGAVEAAAVVALDELRSQAPLVDLILGTGDGRPPRV
jgi:hypothetical protein